MKVFNLSKDEKLIGRLEGYKVVVYKKENPFWRVYFANGYGEDNDNRLILDIVEALHLCDMGKISIFDQNNHLINNEELVKIGRKTKQFWVKYLIYKDLRQRGYPVKIIDKNPVIINLYQRGEKPINSKPEVSIMATEASKEVELDQLDEAIKISRELETKLVIGIVDELGEVTYYSVIEVLEDKET